MRHATHFRITKKKEVNYKLTILIPTLPSRLDTLKELLTELNYQIQSKPIQILYLGDNKSLKVGEKRNILKSLAKGEWITYIDDDDKVSEDYISSIIEAINENPSKTVLCFQGNQTTGGVQDLPFRYNVNYQRNFKKEIDGKRWKVMIPDHLCVWRKSQIVEDFTLKNLGEDHDWAKLMAFHYTDQDQVLIDKEIYHYRYDSKKTECRR